MAWTAPRTWVDGELVSASVMNTHVRDNLNALKSPPTAEDTEDWDTGSDLTVTATSFADIDATTLKVTITTTGGAVLVGHTGSYFHSAGAICYWTIDVDGTPEGGTHGIAGANIPTGGLVVSFVRLITGLSAGSHTFKLQARVVSGTLSLYAGGSGAKIHSQLWAREI